MIRPSTHRTTASYVTDRQVSVGNVGDLVVGDGVCLYGAGPAEDQLVAPALPAIVDEQDGETRHYRFRYMSTSRATGPVSADFSARVASGSGRVVLEWPIGSLAAEARWLIVYRGLSPDSLTPVGSIVCRPIGEETFADFRLVFVDDGDNGFQSRGLPAWFPSAEQPASRHGRLRTTITGVSGNTLTLAQAVAPGLAGGTLAHDAGQSLQQALDEGDDVRLPAGIYQCHGDLQISGEQQELIGHKPRRGELRTRFATELVFEDGDGLVVRGKSNRVARLTVTQPPSRSLPALNLALPMRPRDGDDVWIHGAAMLVESRLFMESVTVQRCRGSGIAIVAKAGTLAGNANLCNWNDIESNQHLGHGLFIDGSDANAGVFTALSLVGNAGWGLLDESLLGNAYIGPHTSANGIGAYRIDSNANRSTVLYAYTEQGQGPSVIGPYALVLGGPAGLWEGRGGNVLLGNGFQRWTKVGSETETRFGHHKRDDMLRRYDSSALRHHRIVSGVGGSSSIDDYAPNSGYIARRWHAKHPRGYGLMEFPRGVLIGGRMVRAIDPSSPPPGTYAVGDLCIDMTGGATRHPSEPFGVGGAWESGKTYRVGDVIVPENGSSYVCTDTTGETGAVGGKSGTVEPTWGAGSVVDNEVQWDHWGSDTAHWLA